MNKIEEIEEYLNGTMDEAKRSEFESRMNLDSELTMMVQEELDARKLVEAAGRIDLQETLTNFEADLSKSDTKKVLPLWVKRVLPIAAMLVIFFAVYQFVQPRTMTTSEAYESYFETYPSTVLRDDGEENLLHKALSLYSEGAFEKSLTVFRQLEETETFAEGHFYHGLCSMQLNAPKYENALQQFDSVLATDNDFREQATWYKALCLLKLNKQEKAFQLLESIVAKQTFQHTKAQELLELKITP